MFSLTHALAVILKHKKGEVQKLKEVTKIKFTIMPNQMLINRP